jgi:hypothetical protein
VRIRKISKETASYQEEIIMPGKVFSNIIYLINAERLALDIAMASTYQSNMTHIKDMNNKHEKYSPI